MAMIQHVCFVDAVIPVESAILEFPYSDSDRYVKFEVTYELDSLGLTTKDHVASKIMATEIDLSNSFKTAGQCLMDSVLDVAGTKGRVTVRCKRGFDNTFVNVCEWKGTKYYKDISFPISGSVYFRESTGEWVLELKGVIEDTDFVCRHTQPARTRPEDVPGLPSIYESLEAYETFTLRIQSDIVEEQPWYEKLFDRLKEKLLEIVGRAV